MESRQNPSASWALWIPTIWLAKVGSSDLAYWLGRGDAEPGTGSPYERSLLILLLCLALMILVKRRFDWYKVMKENIWVTVLILYMFASICWSDIPFTSLKRWIRELTAVAMAFLILSEANPRNAVQSVLMRCIYVLIPFSLLLVVFFPQYGIQSFGIDQEMWVGVTNHKNGLGRLCYVSIFLIVWKFTLRGQESREFVARQELWIHVIMIGIALLLMKGPGPIKASPVTAMLVLALGLAIFYGLSFMRRIQRKPGLNVLRILVAAIIVLGTVTAFVGGLIAGDDIMSTFGREESLSGRTQIWAHLVPVAMKEPMIGYGIGGFWTSANKASLGNIPHAHNGYLDIILDYGFFGLVFISMFCLSSCKGAYEALSYDHSWGSLWICFLFMTLIYNITEPSMDTFTSHQMAINLFLYVASMSTFVHESQEDNLPISEA